MISFNQLGNLGRLGNQMFQYASLRGIAANRGFDFIVPPKDYNHTSNYGLFDCFKMSSVNKTGFVNGKNIVESNHSFDTDIFSNCPDNVNLEGFFQTEKYFENISNSIREDFTFIDEYLNPCKSFIDQFDEVPIFLHVRRIDNISREQYHPIHPISYYEKSLEQFSLDVPVIVLTDDISWCKEQKLFSSDRFYFNESQESYSYKTMDGLGKMQNSLVPYVDLCLMSLCNGAIIANSSLSWWGAWLQTGNPKIIAPMPWFGSALRHLDVSDIVPKRWIIEEVK